MTTNHIDQLTEWWENAEVPTRATLPKDGDRIIIRYNSEWYEIATADGDAGESEISDDTRVLSRAPKPKPAWHDAKAVIAHTSIRDRRVFVNALDGEWLDADTGSLLPAYALRDPIPLIEAKVTDEMIDRAYTAWGAARSCTKRGLLADAIAAALGIEPA